MARFQFVPLEASAPATPRRSARAVERDSEVHLHAVVVRTWSHALALRDTETEDHTRRVTRLTVDLVRRLGFRGRSMRDVRWGALLHDVGKIGVPDRILHKPGPLTSEEWAVMRLHPVHARDLLRSLGLPDGVLEIPHCHHERWDGTGYPRSLSGPGIPLSARAFAVVDVYDALRSPRPYRQAWPRERVLSHVRRMAGSHFDPAVVEAFLEAEAVHHRRNGGSPTPSAA